VIAELPLADCRLRLPIAIADRQFAIANNRRSALVNRIANPQSPTIADPTSSIESSMANRQSAVRSAIANRHSAIVPGPLTPEQP
jgi:hypothetical protein